MAKTGDVTQVMEATLSGNNLKHAIDDADLTQELTAELSGISYRHLNRLVMNRCEPTMMMALRLAAVLRKPVTSLFDFDLKLRTRKRATGTNHVLRRRQPA